MVSSSLGQYRKYLHASDYFTSVTQFSNVPAYHPLSHTYKRIITDTALNSFRAELHSVNWNMVTQSTCPNESFNLFLNKFNLLYRKHSLLKKLHTDNKHSKSL